MGVYILHTPKNYSIIGRRVSFVKYWDPPIFPLRSGDNFAGYSPTFRQCFAGCPPTSCRRLIGDLPTVYQPTRLPSAYDLPTIN
jgi:hypothetical protein